MATGYHRACPSIWPQSVLVAKIGVRSHCYAPPQLSRSGVDRVQSWPACFMCHVRAKFHRDYWNVAYTFPLNAGFWSHARSAVAT